MKAVFADSFHFLALLNQNDPAHARAVIEHRRKWPGMVTTDCVLLEVGDAFCAPRDREDFLALHDALPLDGRIKIVRLDRELFERGIERFRQRCDKDWPLTDCISFLVMEDAGLTEALTADQHFEQAGFKALLK